jgi:hypothetical protein
VSQFTAADEAELAFDNVVGVKDFGKLVRGIAVFVVALDPDRLSRLVENLLGGESVRAVYEVVGDGQVLGAF